MDSCLNPASPNMSYISVKSEFNQGNNKMVQLAYECLSDDDQTLDVELVFTQIQDLQSPISLENLSKICDAILFERNVNTKPRDSKSFICNSPADHCPSDPAFLMHPVLANYLMPALCPIMQHSDLDHAGVHDHSFQIGQWV